jgi:hypothetical protein
MATRAFTNVSSTIGAGMQPINFGGEDGLIIVFYRVQGGTVGDTVTIPASDTRWSDDIRSVGGTLDATTSISTSANTQVVLTMTSSAASTSVNYDVFLICKRQTT